MARVRFCGVICGSVTVRPGETEQDAVNRAQVQLLELMTRSAKSLSYADDPEKQGPNVGLELDVNQD